MSLRERQRVVAGVRTRTVEGGAGPGLLLLHGLGATSYSWRAVLPELAKARSVCAPDFPGFGRAEKPRGFDYSLAGFGAWLRALLRELGWERAALAGNSMGGAVSLRLALEAPGLVESATLIGCPVYPQNTPHVLWHLRRPLLGRLLEPLVGPWLVGPLARQCFVDKTVITPELLEEYGAPLREPEGRRAVIEFVRRAVPPDADALVARYAQLATPVLAIRGEHDHIVDRESVERFCRTAPRARFVAIPGAGHAPQEESPAAVLPEMLRFLAA